MDESRRVGFYLRVSTATGRQTVANQRHELQEAARRHRWTVVHEFVDHASGKQDKRPGFVALKHAVNRREIDVVAVSSVDRLARSTKDLCNFLDQLEAKNVHLYVHRSALDTATPHGRALFQMASVFSEFETALIRERIHAGLARAKAEGKRLGRPPISAIVEAQIREELAKGRSIRHVAQIVGVSSWTVHRVRKPRFTPVRARSERETDTEF